MHLLLLLFGPEEEVVPRRRDLVSSILRLDNLEDGGGGGDLLEDDDRDDACSCVIVREVLTNVEVGEDLLYDRVVAGDADDHEVLDQNDMEHRNTIDFDSSLVDMFVVVVVVGQQHADDRHDVS